MDSEEISDISDLEAMLKGSVLFQEVDEVAIQYIRSQLTVMRFRRGEPIILENEISDGVYFIKSGAVEILKYRPEIQQVHRITILQAGTHFSEFSVLNHANKSASAFAYEDAVLYRMSGEAFLNVIQKFPKVGQRLVTTLAGLISGNFAKSAIEYFDPADILPILNLPPTLSPTVWKKFGILPLSLRAGILRIAMKDPQKPDFFNHCKANAGNPLVSVVLIGEADFDQALKRLTKLYAPGSAAAAPTATVAAPSLDVSECLLRTPHFAGIPESGLAQLMSMFEAVDLEMGADLFQAGVASEYFYIVQSGRIVTLRATRENHAWSGMSSHGPGAGLSEISLVLNKPETHLARAVEPSRVLRMTKDTFSRFLNSGVFCLNLAKILARELQHITDANSIPFYDPNKPLAVAELVNLIPRQMCQQHHVIPLRLEDSEVTLGVVNPGNEAIYSITNRYLRGYRIHLELITLENFKAWIMATPGAAQPKMAPAAQAAALASGNQTVVELNRLLIEGFEARASDLHLEPTGSGYSIRYRVDGVLTETANKLVTEVGEAIVNRIKVMGHMDISNRMTPQDGQLKVNDNGQEYSARVATTPTRLGEGAVLRLVRSRNSAVPLSMLAPEPRAIGLLKKISRVKQGLFLVTGPTGSGKTTTLYSLIAELNRVDVKIITLEDPVELEIPGVTQIEINEKQGLTFERALRSTLRQDPDVMILGEIRDPESAKSVFDAALAGHLVISTLHTNNSFAVKNRLKELGVPLGTMAAGLIGAMAQRLVRSICKKCRTLRPINTVEIQVLKERLRLPRIPTEMHVGSGCNACNQSGFRGRMPIMEIWEKNRSLEELINVDAGIDAMLHAARNDQFDTLFEFGLKMALNGLTTVEEVARCLAGNL